MGGRRKRRRWRTRRSGNDMRRKKKSVMVGGSRRGRASELSALCSRPGRRGDTSRTRAGHTSASGTRVSSACPRPPSTGPVELELPSARGKRSSSVSCTSDLVSRPVCACRSKEVRGAHIVKQDARRSCSSDRPAVRASSRRVAAPAGLLSWPPRIVHPSIPHGFGPNSPPPGFPWDQTTPLWLFCWELTFEPMWTVVHC